MTSFEFLNTRIAPLCDPSGSTYFAYDEFFPRNEELDLKRRESALAKHAYMTVNEVRAEQGLPPVRDGDVVPQPFPAPKDGGDHESSKSRPLKPVKHLFGVPVFAKADTATFKAFYSAGDTSMISIVLHNTQTSY